MFRDRVKIDYKKESVNDLAMKLEHLRAEQAELNMQYDNLRFYATEMAKDLKEKALYLGKISSVIRQKANISFQKMRIIKEIGVLTAKAKSDGVPSIVVTAASKK